MNKKIKLSICIPVFNQIDLVKTCVENIINYTDDDIEIVVSDDCSTEDIKGMLQTLNDNRIKYVKNEVNLGHDLNIINCLKNCSAKYAFLLRTRDLILHEQIGFVIKTLEKHNNIAYLTGSAIDEEGNLKMCCKEKMFLMGKESFNINQELFIHPSGQVYNVQLLDLSEIANFIKETIDTKFSFVVHSLIRTILVFKGNFYTTSVPIWQYTNTSRCKDTAVNSTKSKESVYSFAYEQMRYVAEIKWSLEKLTEPYRYWQIKNIFRNYMQRLTWGVWLHNKNKAEHKHYGSKKVNFSVNKAQREMIKTTNEIVNKALDKSRKKEFTLYIHKVMLYNQTLNRLKFNLIHLMYKLDIYDLVCRLREKHRKR